jgi:hypothetical protein
MFYQIYIFALQTQNIKKGGLAVRLDDIFEEA